MTSLIVIYDGRRFTTKIAPNDAMQKVLAESCEHFNIQHTNARFKKGRTIIDLAQPFRFTNLAPNSTIDIEVVESSAHGNSGTSSCRVALSIEGGGSATATFPAQTTLTSMLAQFVTEGKLSPNVLQLNPELIYLRSSFSGSALSTTSLATLGLSGQSCRFQLRVNDSTGSIASSGSELSTLGPSSTPVPHTPSLRTDGAPDPPSNNVSQKLAHDSPASNESTLNDSEVHASPVPLIDASSSRPTKAAPPCIKSAIKSILSSNFDAVSTPACILILKILINVILHDDPKYRNVSRGGKVFAAVIACAGGEELMQSIGFLLIDGKYVLSDQAVDRARLLEACTALDAALNALNVPQTNRPKVPSTLPASTLQSAPAFEFDPFKSFSRKVADSGTGQSTLSRPADHGATISTTDAQLSRLLKRRYELEGRVEDVARCTELMLYSSGGSQSTAFTVTADNGKMILDTETEPSASTPTSQSSKEPSDSSLLAASLKKKLLHPADEAPLTTRAVRELQTLQTARVYSRVVVRVRMPDKSQIQAYFHPREGMWEVYAWLASCLVGGISEDSRGATGGSEAMNVTFAGSTGSGRTGSQSCPAYAFELYTSPPRTVQRPVAPYTRIDTQFLPASSTGGSESGANSYPIPDSFSLQGLKMTPAALLNFAWLESSITATSKQSSAIFQDHVLIAADGKSVESQYPIGERIATGPISTMFGASSVGGAGGIGVSGEDMSMDVAEVKEESRAKVGHKPKWFKM